MHEGYPYREMGLDVEGTEISGDIRTRIADAFQSEEFEHALQNESFGGNAGKDQSAIHSIVKKSSGEILAFGNPQNLPESISNNPKNLQVTFVYSYDGNSESIRLLKGDDLPPEAIDNIEAGLKITNERLSH